MHDGTMCSGYVVHKIDQLSTLSFRQVSLVPTITTNTWKFNSYSIDLDNDGIGHNLDKFPYEKTQQKDSDLDGYGDNSFGNNADDCPMNRKFHN